MNAQEILPFIYFSFATSTPLGIGIEQSENTGNFPALDFFILKERNNNKKFHKDAHIIGKLTLQ